MPRYARPLGWLRLTRGGLTIAGMPEGPGSARPRQPMLSRVAMGKFLGLCFFACGMAAVYFWGVRPLLSQSSTASTLPPVTIVARATTPPASSTDQQAAARAARAFLAAWQGKHYSAMYDELTAAAKHRISRRAFESRYSAIADEATIESVSATVGSVTLDVPLATVGFNVQFVTQALGSIRQTNEMHLVFTGDRWQVDWYPALIFKQLVDPYVVHLETLPSRRGSILDRHGTPLAADGQFMQLGVEPGLILDEKGLLSYRQQLAPHGRSHHQASLHTAVGAARLFHADHHYYQLSARSRPARPANG